MGRVIHMGPMTSWEQSGSRSGESECDESEVAQAVGSQVTWEVRRQSESGAKRLRSRSEARAKRLRKSGVRASWEAGDH